MAASSDLRTTSESINHNDDGEKYADGVQWDEVGFVITPTDFMYTMNCSDGNIFSQGHLIPYRNIELCPSAGILNYGQGILEALKAVRTEDGRIMLFRPEENSLIMKMGAERMCMPSPSVEQFVDAVKQTVLANKRWVPPPGKGSLYLRPLLLGSGSVLSVGPAPECTFLIYASPVGNSSPVGNYHKVYQAQKQARAKGFSDILYLDSVTGKCIEEISAANIFIVMDNVICTPALVHGTILPGVTRSSIMEIALDLGYQVEERLIPREDLLEAGKPSAPELP
ncbi:hypothetical protein ACLB2K_017086 [Fragaria x ananassa]